MSNPLQNSVSAADGLPLMPGHLIRRLQQIAVAIFLEDTAAFGITPVQFAALRGLAAHPGVDQRTLAAQVGLDASTLGGVVDRLESRRWVTRQPSQTDRRVKLLHITAEGVQLLRDMAPAIEASQQRILAPLSPSRRAQFISMLTELVDKNNDLSRAPIPGED